MILSLDISTKCIGITLLKDNGLFHKCGYVWLKDIKEEKAKADFFSEQIKKITGRVKIKNIFVEAPLKASNNQNVVNMLQRWNAICCCVLYYEFGVWPELIPERDVRKLLGIIVPKGVTGKDKKRFILDYVKNLGAIPEYIWELNRAGNPCDFCYDIADSYLVARAGYEQG